MYHWQEAQQQQRRQTGTNIIVSSDERHVIVGKEDRGWVILTPVGSVTIQTALGVECMLEELEVPLLGWH